MKTTSILLGAALCAWLPAAAFAADAAPQPQQRRPQAPARVPAELAAFFGGDWSGHGQFASGRPIEADASFRLELDGHWLQYRHTDRAPNTYRALGMWGIDSATGKLTMTLNDSMGGARTFTSDGWTGTSLMFLRTVSAQPLLEERFVFTRLSDDSFRMAYEVHPGGKPWRLVDQLQFERATR